MTGQHSCMPRCHPWRHNCNHAPAKPVYSYRYFNKFVHNPLIIRSSILQSLHGRGLGASVSK